MRKRRFRKEQFRSPLAEQVQFLRILHNIGLGEMTHRFLGFFEQTPPSLEWRELMIQVVVIDF